MSDNQTLKSHVLFQGRPWTCTRRKGVYELLAVAGLAIAACAATVPVPASAAASSFPTRPVRFVVPFAPVGIYFLFQRLHDNGDAKIFLIIYGTIAWYPTTSAWAWRKAAVRRRPA